MVHVNGSKRLSTKCKQCIAASHQLVMESAVGGEGDVNEPNGQSTQHQCKSGPRNQARAHTRAHVCTHIYTHAHMRARESKQTYVPRAEGLRFWDVNSVPAQNRRELQQPHVAKQRASSRTIGPADNYHSLVEPSTRHVAATVLLLLLLLAVSQGVQQWKGTCGVVVSPTWFDPTTCQPQNTQGCVLV